MSYANLNRRTSGNETVSFLKLQRIKRQIVNELFAREVYTRRLYSIVETDSASQYRRASRVRGARHRKLA